jgi:RNA 2',3'-cyclic 3'-phosphodiesterase
MADQPRKRKLFVGIALDEGPREACAAVSEQLRKTGFTAKYESAEKLHVTLAFLGFVEPSRYDAIIDTLRSCAARSEPFSLTLDKLAAFPHERRPRVAFLGAREQGAAFRALASGVREAYAALNFEFDKDPVAHVTIARAKDSNRPLPAIEFVPISFAVAALTLFESLPDPARKTSRYETAYRSLMSSLSSCAPFEATGAGGCAAEGGAAPERGIAE